MRVSSEPCHGCGQVRDLTGEYPEWTILCYRCQELFTCICWEVADYEYNGWFEE